MSRQSQFPLHDAAKNGNLAEVRRLLDSGVVSIDARDNGFLGTGRTALICASQMGHVDIVSFLLDRGASIDIQSFGGQTALMISCLNGKDAVVNLLLERGANLSMRNQEGKTATDIAKQEKKPKCVEIIERYEQERPMREQSERAQRERDQKEREEREEREREENDRNRVLVSTLTAQLRQKEQENLSLRSQISIKDDSIREIELEKNKSKERVLKLEEDFLTEFENFENKMELLSNQLKSCQSIVEERDQEIIGLKSEKDKIAIENEVLINNLRNELSQSQRHLENVMKERDELLEMKNININRNVNSNINEREIKGELNQEIEELKSCVIARFQHERNIKLNEMKYQKYLELNEKIKNTKNKMEVNLLRSELKSLNYVSVNMNERMDVIPLERIEIQVKELYDGLKSKEHQFLGDDDIISSMLCEVDRLNLLNLLKVFEMEIKIGDDDGNNDDNFKKEEKDQIISNLHEQNRILNIALNVKEGELKEKQSIITRFESKLGIGLKTPHVRFLDIGKDFNLKDIMINHKDDNNNNSMKILNGIFHNQGMDFNCKLKVVMNIHGNGNGNQVQLRKLEREKDILEIIRARDPHQANLKFIVNWLFPSSQFLNDENIYFLDKLGDQISPLMSSPLQSQPPRSRNYNFNQGQSQSQSISMYGLVFESGGMNLREFLKNQQSYSSVSMTQRVHILEEIVEAVRFLHKLEIIHFDLKPENIVLFGSCGDSNKMRWKLIDFDSSYDEKSSPSISSLSNDNDNVWLTEEFVCPEVMKVLFPSSSSSMTITINSKMDIWSLGLIAFFLFTNRSLWSEYSSSFNSYGSMVAQINQDDIDLILSRTLKFREKEKSFVESCLQVNPIDRLDAVQLLKKSLFSTGNSTIQANTLKVSNETIIARIVETENLLKQYSERCSEFMSEELNSKFEDFHFCLVSKLEGIQEG